MEQMIAEEQPQLRILRLLCLQYMLSSNVDRDQFKKYRREMVQVYGFEMLFTFENLEKVGFLGNRLPEKQKRQDWRQLRTVFSLQKPQKQVAERNISVNSETGTVTDCDPNLVFNGCAPLSVKIVQAATTKNWNAIAAPSKAVTVTASNSAARWTELGNTLSVRVMRAAYQSRVSGYHSGWALVLDDLDGLSARREAPSNSRKTIFHVKTKN